MSINMQMVFQTDNNSRLIVTDELWSLIRSINREGNAFVGPPLNWGMVVPDAVSRSDALVIWKASALIGQGVPGLPLWFTLCRDETGVNHSLLCIASNRGDLVLDDRYPDVVSYDDLKAVGYRMLFRSSVNAGTQYLIDTVASYR